jgi:hypothetical protein
MEESPFLRISILEERRMGSDDFFKRKRERNEERKADRKRCKPNSFIIISEGAKTEPYYFDGLAQYIKEKNNGSTIGVENPIIDTHGEGRCTVSLVLKAIEIIKSAHIVYEHIWIAFDKDDFDDFDKAIELAHQYGYNVAWSNQSFEYWIYLHFNYADAALHRDLWYNKLQAIYKQYDIPNGYQKNDEQIFKIATTHGSLRTAVRNANSIEKKYCSGEKPSLCDPCTKVHQLILELQPFIEELLS